MSSNNRPATPAVLGLDRAVFVMANELLSCLCDQLALTIGGPVCRCCLYPGEEIAPMDWCCPCDEGQGQAAVRVYRIFPVTARFPQQEFNPKRCDNHSYGVTFEMTVYRCACTIQENGEPPTCDCLMNDVAIQIDDAAAMRRAVACCFVPQLSTTDGPLANFVLADTFVEDDYNPIGPRGDCFGGRQRFTFGFYDVDCDCPPVQPADAVP